MSEAISKRRTPRRPPPPGKAGWGPKNREHLKSTGNNTAPSPADAPDPRGTDPFSTSQAADVIRALEELAAIAGRPRAEIVPARWERVREEAWYCATMIRAEAEGVGDLSKEIALCNLRPPKRDPHRWQRLKRMIEGGHIDLGAIRKSIMAAWRRGHRTAAWDFLHRMRAFQYGAWRAGVTSDLRCLRGADLHAAYSAALSKSGMFHDAGGHRRDGPIEVYFTFLTRAFKEITGQLPTAGVSHLSDRPGTPAARFCLAACSFLSPTVHSVNGRIKKLTAAPAQHGLVGGDDADGPEIIEDPSLLRDL